MIYDIEELVTVYVKAGSRIYNHLCNGHTYCRAFSFYTLYADKTVHFAHKPVHYRKPQPYSSGAAAPRSVALVHTIVYLLYLIRTHAYSGIRYLYYEVGRGCMVHCRDMKVYTAFRCKLKCVIEKMAEYLVYSARISHEYGRNIRIKIDNKILPAFLLVE